MTKIRARIFFILEKSSLALEFRISNFLILKTQGPDIKNSNRRFFVPENSGLISHIWSSKFSDPESSVQNQKFKTRIVWSLKLRPQITSSSLKFSNPEITWHQKVKFKILCWVLRTQVWRKNLKSDISWPWKLMYDSKTEVCHFLFLTALAWHQKF